MTPRVWTHLIIVVVATLCLCLGMLNEGEPYFRSSSAQYDGTRRAWDVSGEVAYPSAGTLTYPGGKAKVMERVVPFAITIPDPAGKLSIQGQALPLAVAATKGIPGRRDLNVFAFGGGWLVCYGALWLGWLLIRPRKAPENPARTSG